VFRTLESKTVFSGRVLELRLDRVAEPGGVTAIREVVCHRGSVVVLPRRDDGRVVLVRQFRYAARKHLWELVAGGLQPDETPLQAARRELAEETGFRARSLKRLISFYPSPGFLTERMHLIEARGLAPAQAQPEADEHIEVAEFSAAELRKMLDTGKLEDAKTLVGLLWILGAVS
jgi:ADP-ribose pyrophosphatase